MTSRSAKKSGRLGSRPHSRRNLRVPVWLGILTALLFFVLPEGFDRFEYTLLDLRMKLRQQYHPDPFKNIILVLITPDDLAKLGRWPWYRDSHTILIDVLTEAGAKVIAFDIMFPEPSEDKSQDDRMIAAVNSSGKVTLPYYFDLAPPTPSDFDITQPSIEDHTNQAWLKKHGLPAESTWLDDFFRADGVEPPLKELDDAASGLGFINVELEEDGILRQTLLVTEYDGYLFPSLGLRAVCAYLDLDWQTAVVEPGKQITLTSTDGQSGRTIPINSRGELAVNYRSWDNYLIDSFNYLSILSKALAVNSEVDLSIIKDKIVLIGWAAEGMLDNQSVPIAKEFPLVAYHAQVIDNILKEDYLRSYNWLDEFLLLCFLGILIGLVLPRLSIVRGGIVAILTVVLLALCGYYSLEQFSYWMPLFRPMGVLFGSYFLISLYYWLAEEKGRKEISGYFSRYVSEEVLSEILADPEKVAIGGERRRVTVLYSDIRGFTEMAETMEPEEVLDLLNQHFEVLTEAVLEQDGTIDKYMGDAIMALFGAPFSDRDAERAVDTAWRMQQGMVYLREKLRLAGKPEVEIGIGINSGEMVVGNIGTEKKQEYTVIGDNVNLAFRLVGVAGPGEIIISEQTRQELGDRYICQELEPVQVKGKSKPVKIYSVTGLQEPK